MAADEAEAAEATAALAPPGNSLNESSPCTPTREANEERSRYLPVRL